MRDAHSDDGSLNESPSLAEPDRVTSPRLFILVVCLIIVFLSFSLLLAINALFAGQILARLILIAGVLLLLALTFVLIWGYAKRELAGTTLGPMCKSLLSEYTLCARCKGFYVGIFFFGLLFYGKTAIFGNLLGFITLAPFLLILVLTAFSVPIHGGLRRLNLIRSEGLLHIIGFVFSVSPYLFATLILSLL